MRVVFDANVFISAIICEKGSSAEIIRKWEGEEFDLITSSPILEEVERVIHYPRIQEKYNLPEEKVREFLNLIRGPSVLVEP
ncbi:MAG: putative toxin-antitoxin system toxin component, PIN family, partial [Chloroflexota bacterium]|nr:putative toxin-antitoxin system toxin component, PIN family [Chloroflexota bacterium]